MEDAGTYSEEKNGGKYKELMKEIQNEYSLVYPNCHENLPLQTILEKSKRPVTYIENIETLKVNPKS
jgi:hypothetical protein